MFRFIPWPSLKAPLTARVWDTGANFANDSGRAFPTGEGWPLEDAINRIALELVTSTASVMSRRIPIPTENIERSKSS